MSFRHSYFSVATLSALLCAWTPSASVGNCGCLFGRTPNFGAGYPYAAGYPYVAGYPGAVSSPYVAGYSPLTLAPATSGTSFGPAQWGAPYSASMNPTYALQAPAYGNYAAARLQDNPSVYTGLPVSPTQPLVQSNALPLYPAAGTNQSVPLWNTLRGRETTAGSFYGTGNLYPNTFGIQPNLSYASGYQGTSGVLGGSSTSIPSTPVAPLFQNSVQPQPSGLARFFGSMFGTGYSSSYYRVPITYYRPVTTVDPVTGAAVVVQQPCASYVDQVQRTPYSSLLATQPQYTPPSNQATCGAPQYLSPGLQAPSTLSPSVLPNTGYIQPNVAPVTNYGGLNPSGYGTGDGSVVPIPSLAPTATQQIAPAYSSNAYLSDPPSASSDPYAGTRLSTPQYEPLRGTSPQTNLAPLTGSTTDMAPVTQPQLESARPSFDDREYSIPLGRFTTPEESGSTDSSDATRLDPPQLTTPSWRLESKYSPSAELNSQADLRTNRRANSPNPIPAPENYRPVETADWTFTQREPSRVTKPASNEEPVVTEFNKPSTKPQRNRLEAPPLPPPTIAPQYPTAKELPRFPAANFVAPSRQAAAKPSVPSPATKAREASLQETRRTSYSTPAPLPKPATETGWYPIER